MKEKCIVFLPVDTLHQNIFSDWVLDASAACLYIAAYLNKSTDCRVFECDVNQVILSVDENQDSRAVVFYCTYENQACIKVLSGRIEAKYGIPCILAYQNCSEEDKDILLRDFNGYPAFRLSDLEKLMDFLGHPEECKKDEKDEEDKKVSVNVNYSGIKRQSFNENWVCISSKCERDNHNKALKSVTQMISELQQLFADLPSEKFIYFSGFDIWSANRDIAGLCDELSQLVPKHSLLWGGKFDTGVLDREDIFAKLKDSGLTRMRIALESCSQDILQLYGSGCGPDQVLKIIQNAKDAGIRQIELDVWVGTAFENRESLQKTREFCERALEIAGAHLWILLQYPNGSMAGRMFDAPVLFGLKWAKGFDREYALNTSVEVPSLFSEELTQLDIILARNELDSRLKGRMLDIARREECPHVHLILENKWKKLNLATPWEEVFCRIPFLKIYCSLLERGAMLPHEALKHENFDSLRPQRNVEIWVDIDFPACVVKLLKMALTPLEFDLILYSSGKLTLLEVKERLLPKYLSLYKSKEEFYSRVESLLLRMQQRYLLGFVRY